ncbi:choice-of-anchor C family protein [Sphingomonas sp. 1P06PA]|uniref:choice-of-anchor C family protein n=1 Tax=Sphingomonas sp. 1P06PA TaxID=554121 RepID=UPI0039A56B15
MRKLLLSIATMALLPGVANAAAFQNGSFEDGPDAGSFITLSAGDTSVTGWTVGAGTVDYIGSYWVASDGTNSFDLSGNGIGSISQTFDTIAGLTYNVTFDLAGNPAGDPATKTLLTMATGGSTQTDTFTVTGANTLANMGWQTFSYSFVAQSASSTLTFSSDTATAFGPALDNVTVTAVPEPAAWALMIGGFGLVGGAMRRRVTKIGYVAV